MAMIYATTKSTAVTAFEAARGQIGNLGSKVVTFSKTTNGKVALGITAATTLVALVAIGYGVFKMVEAYQKRRELTSVLKLNSDELTAKFADMSKIESEEFTAHQENLLEAMYHKEKPLSDLSREDLVLIANKTSNTTLLAEIDDELDFRGEVAAEVALKTEEKRKSQRSILEEASEEGVLQTMSNHPYRILAVAGVAAVAAGFVLGNSNNK